jgi:CRISPR/Cas system Type II protein with McrA/HNH and RuvC-like nuclease domain
MDKKTGKIIVYGLREKNHPHDAITINVTSKSKEEWSRKFSPFTLGSIEVYPYGEKIISENMENAWQFCKVYSGEWIFFQEGISISDG